MLQGLSVESNPLEKNWAEDKELEIVFQDDAMVVINKPSGLLSVPGKTIKTLPILVYKRCSQT